MNQVVAAVDGSRPGSFIYHQYDGYYYHRSMQTYYSEYFKCHRYGRGCRGRGISDAEGRLHLTQLHSCTRDFGYVRILELKRRILERCDRYPFHAFRNIVHEEGRRFPLHIRAQLNPNQLRSAMRRVRLKRFPPVPETLEDLVNLLADPYYAFLTETEDGDNLFASFVEARDGSHHLILISSGMCTVLGLVRWLFVDGHFASRPVKPPSSQILNLVTVIDHHTVWLGCALMESRTEAAYDAVFTTLRDLAPNLNPEVIVCDFERALLNSLLQIFQLAQILGCLWHFARAVLKKAISLGMAVWFRNSRRIRRLLRMFCVLPLLPEDLMLHGLFEIAYECWRHGDFMYDLFSPLLDYMLQKWVCDPIRRQVMCVYGSIHRTNNACETTNRWMKSEMGTVRPSVFSFLGAVGRMDGNSKSTMLALNEGRAPTRARKTSALINDANIKMLTRQLIQRPLGVRHAIRNFLLYASNTMRGAFNVLIDNVEE